MSISAFVWHPFHFFLTLLIKKKLQDPSEVIKCICPFLECLITLVRCTDSPPSECQKRKKIPFWLPFRISLQLESCVLSGVSWMGVPLFSWWCHLGWRPVYHNCQLSPNLSTKLVTSGMLLRSQCLLSQMWTTSGRFLLPRVNCFPCRNADRSIAMF